MEDPAKVMVAVAFFISAAYSVNAIARAAIALQKGRRESNGELAPSVGDSRLARIEQAVDAIALEVERISEAQRFTTRLLSENSHMLPKPSRRDVSVNTPT